MNLTVFEPDIEFDGGPYDYFTALTDIDTDYALEVKKESPKEEAAIARSLPQLPDEGLSKNILPQYGRKARSFRAVFRLYTMLKNKSR